MSEKLRLPSVETLLNLTNEYASATKTQSQSFSSLPYSGNQQQHHHHRSGVPLYSTAERSHHTDSFHPARKDALELQSQSYTRLPSVEEVLQGKNFHHHKQMTYGTTSDDSRSSKFPRASFAPSPPAGKPGYPCERCGRLFTRKSDAIKHIRVVHDRLMPFSCAVCGRKFARKDYCMKHEKSIHNITPPTSPHQTRKKTNKTST